MRICAYTHIRCRAFNYSISHNDPFAKWSRHETPAPSLSYRTLHAEGAHSSDFPSMAPEVDRKW